MIRGKMFIVSLEIDIGAWYWVGPPLYMNTLVAYILTESSAQPQIFQYDNVKNSIKLYTFSPNGGKVADLAFLLVNLRWEIERTCSPRGGDAWNSRSKTEDFHPVLQALEDLIEEFTSVTYYHDTGFKTQANVTQLYTLEI